MRYEFNFGQMENVPPKRAGKGSEVFRLAVLGDFSARANRGEVAVGDDLAARKPLRVDVDNFDDMIRRMGIKLQLDVGGDGGAVEVEINSIDDFHPDELYGNLEIFSHLSSLRQQLNNRSTFAKAAKEVQSWPGVNLPKLKKRRARGSAIATDCKLSDFAQLLERPISEPIETSIQQLIKQIVGPHVIPAKDPKQDALIAAVDAAISDLMRRVLHHPDFQTTEALWRSVDLLIRRIETGANLKIVLYDITAEELAADLSSSADLQETGLYKLLVEQPAMDAQQGAISAIVGNYMFEQTPPHAELLGRLAKIAAAAQAPFLAAIGTECLKKVNPDDVHPLILESWSALRSLPEAAYVGLTVPRFMLRDPYGRKTSPIDRFEFEEFTPQYGLRGMLWANSAILAGLLLAETFQQQGFKKMNLGSVLTVGDMPYYYYTDEDGDQTALPCTERLITISTAEHVSSQGFMPVLAIRGRNEVRLGGFRAVRCSPLAGPWAAPGATPSPAKAAKAEEPKTRSERAEEPSEETAAPPADEAADSSSGGDDDLDSLLASLGGGDETKAEEGAAEEKKDEGGGSEEMDPDLAALLADL